MSFYEDTYVKSLNVMKCLNHEHTLEFLTSDKTRAVSVLSSFQTSPEH